MRVWRLTRRPFADLSGEGARLYGGRWTSPGHAVIYTSSSRSLALLEVLVHLGIVTELLPEDYVAMEIEIPDRVSRTRVARGYDQPRRAGDRWLARQVHAVLAVPSVVVPGEWNYLINPLHPDAAHIRTVEVTDFAIDKRLLQGRTVQ